VSSNPHSSWHLPQEQLSNRFKGFFQFLQKEKRAIVYSREERRVYKVYSRRSFQPIFITRTVTIGYHVQISDTQTEKLEDKIKIFAINNNKKTKTKETEIEMIKVRWEEGNKSGNKTADSDVEELIDDE
jgi:hypothetical protein